ncbi:MAG TPA: hypothetical protein PLB01_12645 [Thermoanaerobaculia bacterium]|nr:hypothetical protein [Thermoanaerobaculia bacterium]
MIWPFGKKAREGWRDKPQAITSAIPRDDDRAGPVPPPPRTAHAPGVAIHGYSEVPSQHLLRLDTGHAGFFLEGEEGKDRSSALLVLEPGGATTPGDVLLWSSPLSLSLEEISRTSPRPSHHIRRDDLSGRGVSGITGLRSRHEGGGITVLRFGPPPGARWVFVGLRAIAVFAGKVTLVDGEESKVVPAGRIALVGDPTATLYVEAGNDSALAVALGGARVVSALG